MEWWDGVVGWSGGMEGWDGVVGWSDGMERWDGVVGWSGGMEWWDGVVVVGGRSRACIDGTTQRTVPGFSNAKSACTPRGPALIIQTAPSSTALR